MGITFYTHYIVVWVIKMKPENKKLVKSTVDFELGAKKLLFRTTFEALTQLSHDVQYR